MCSNWIIDGKWCDHGQDVIDVLGIEKARLVNTMYDIVGQTGWKQGGGGERIEYVVSEQQVADSCLCWVEPDRVKEVTGIAYEFDCDEDAYIPA